MKIFLILISIMILVNSNLQAQDLSKPIAIFKVGSALTLADEGFKNNWGMGGGISFALGKKVMNNGFATFEFAYSKFNLIRRKYLINNGFDTDKYFVDGGARSFLNLSAIFTRKFFADNDFVPYVFGGIGVYSQYHGNIKVDFGRNLHKAISDEYELGLSSMGGIGLEFPLQKDFFKFIVEIQYFTTFNKIKTSYLPIKAGIVLFNR